MLSSHFPPQSTILQPGCPSAEPNMQQSWMRRMQSSGPPVSGTASPWLPPQVSLREAIRDGDGGTCSPMSFLLTPVLQSSCCASAQNPAALQRTKVPHRRSLMTSLELNTGPSELWQSILLTKQGPPMDNTHHTLYSMSYVPPIEHLPSAMSTTSTPTVRSQATGGLGAASNA